MLDTITPTSDALRTFGKCLTPTPQYPTLTGAASRGAEVSDFMSTSAGLRCPT